MERPYCVLVVTMWFINLKSAVYRIRFKSRHCNDRKQSRLTPEIASFHGVTVAMT